MRFAALLLLVFLTAAVPTIAQATITVSIVQPNDFGYYGDTVLVRATVSSTYQLQQVTATVADRSMNLTYASGEWTGTLSLAGLPRGTLVLQVTAQDVFNATGSATRSFSHDKGPQITVSAPLPETVARPLIHVTASCADDDPAGCRSLNVSCNSYIVATGTSIDQDVSLDGCEAGLNYLYFFARDSVDQPEIIARLIYIDSSAHLRQVDEVLGRIFDVQADRILYRSWPDVDNARIRDRASDTDTATLAAAGKQFGYGFLAPRGAIFVASDTLYEWQDGALLTFGMPNSTASLHVAGPYAIWNESPAPAHYTLFRRNLVTGTTMQLPFDNHGNIDNDVAADGTVAFWTLDYNVYLFKNDALQQLTTSTPDIWYVSPRTDGTHTLYRRQTKCCSNQTYAIEHHNGTTAVEIAPPRTQQPSPDIDYQVSNAWIAVTRAGLGGENQVWRIAPGGAAEQLSFLGTSSQIDLLSPDGELTFVNFASKERRLSKPSVAPYVINSAAGRSFRIDGQWYVAMGRSLFAIVDLAATTTVVTASPNPSVSGANATFTATVTDAGATGTVAFKDGQMTLGSATLSGGTATFSTSSLAFGSHTITAVYGGDPDFAPSVSAPYTHQVKTATTTLLSSSANPSTAGLSVTFTATMTPSAATGSVTFSDGATVLGTTPLSSGTATLSTSSLAPGTHSITATYSGDATRAGSTSSALSQQVESSFGAPVGLVATATTATHIVVTWAGVQGATSYEVTRSSHGGGFSVVGYPTSPAFVDDGVAPDTTYLYMVRAIAGGGSFSSFSNIDPATTVIFTDDPLTPGVSVITAAHITQIRTAVNAMRASVGLAPATFSSDSVVRAVHIQELRNALDPARAALSLPALTYTDPTLVAGSTPIRAVHMQELREGCR